MTRLPLLLVALLSGGLAAPSPEALTVTADHRIQYNPYPDGDRIPDYSYCGYRASDAPIPDLLADPSVYVLRVSPSGGDDTRRIQDALDHVGGLPLRSDGFRGVVLLEAGRFRLDGSLKMECSGVVLRGSGVQETTLFAAGHGRETVVAVAGKDDAGQEASLAIPTDYLPVNSLVIPLPAGHSLRPGDRVRITRPATQEWISLLGATGSV